MTFEKLLLDIPSIEKKLGYSFQNRYLLASALVHRSYINEHKDLPIDHNERLEFLGDSVLNLLLAQYLFEKYPKNPEGQLSSFRAHAVSSAACVQYMEQLDIDLFILVGRGEKLQANKGRTSILADCFEAILGAIYLDSNLDEARRFFFSHFEKTVEEIVEGPSKNYKALLQEQVQKEAHLMPEYRLMKATGPDHERLFEIAVFLEDRCIGQGTGFTKKEAEQKAAHEALKTIKTGENP
jgi:ribonuclease III